MRQEVERKIVAAVIDGALAAGYTLDVNDGEETTLTKSADKGKILAAMFTTDEDWLLVNDAKGRAKFGWVRFIYGNDGWDVVSDYTTNLEPIMGEANKISDSYA
jgi:hypothetical protein